MSTSYRVRGTLLATRSAECFLRQLDVADVEHDLVDVNLVVQARDGSAAAQDASWIAASNYATWRWREAPTIEEVER
jgi:hypothetical protein